MYQNVCMFILEEGGGGGGDGERDEKDRRLPTIV